MLRKKIIREGGRKSEGGGYLKQEIKPKRPYGNMVDFSFIVSLYVSDLPNVTISTSIIPGLDACND